MKTVHYNYCVNVDNIYFFFHRKTGVLPSITFYIILYCAQCEGYGLLGAGIFFWK